MRKTAIAYNASVHCKYSSEIKFNKWLLQQHSSRQLDCHTTGRMSTKIKPWTFRMSKDPHNSLNTDNATPSPVTAHYDTMCCNVKNQPQIKDFLTTSSTNNHLLCGGGEGGGVLWHLVCMHTNSDMFKLFEEMNGNWGSSCPHTPNSLQPQISQFKRKQISVLTQMNDDSDSSFKLLSKMNTRCDTACLLGQLTIPAGRGHSVQSRNRLSQLRCPAITPLTLNSVDTTVPGRVCTWKHSQQHNLSIVCLRKKRGHKLQGCCWDKRAQADTVQGKLD